MKRSLRIALCLTAALIPAVAYAQTTGLSVETCAPGVPSWMVVSLITDCVNNNIRAATFLFLNALSSALAPAIGSVLTLAVVIFGFRAMILEEQLPAKALGLGIKIGAVLMFTVSLGGLGTLPFETVDASISIITLGLAPWTEVDMTLGQLFGYAPGLSLEKGVLGFLSGGLYSSASGAFLFFVGGAVILGMVGLAIRAIYSYLLAMTMIAFMMVISVMFIPMIVFGYTERYFRKWLDLLIAAMIQPMLLFAFLKMFFGLINISVGQIFGVLGGNDFRRFWRSDTPLFNWGVITDPALLQHYEALGQARGIPMKQSYLDPALGRTMDTNFLHPPTLDFGPDTMVMWQSLVTQFIGLGIIVYIMITLVDAIPRLADGIAGVSTYMGLENLPFMQQAKGAIQNMMGK